MWDLLYKFFLDMLKFFHGFTGNWGVDILLMTVVFKAVTYPLNQKSAKSMRMMQKFQPKIKEIQAKHKGDQQTIQKEMMKLYKEHGFNPFAGCLPMALQLPIFIILFNVLRNPYINHHMFVNSYFLGLNLTAQLYSPVAGRFLSDVHLALPGMVHLFGSSYIYLPSIVLVGLMGVSTFFMQKTMSPDPSQNTQMLFMNIFMVVIAASIPNGVLLYWVTSNLLQMGQQWLVERQSKNEEVPQPVAVSAETDKAANTRPALAVVKKSPAPARKPKPKNQKNEPEPWKPKVSVADPLTRDRGKSHKPNRKPPEQKGKNKKT